MKVYDLRSDKCGDILVDTGDVNEVCVPKDAATRAKYGWQQDDDGEWYREAA